MKGWLLIETLLVLLVANALGWFVVAMGWTRQGCVKGIIAGDFCPRRNPT